MKKGVFIIFAALFLVSCGLMVVNVRSYILGFYEIFSIEGNASYVQVDGKDYLRVNVHVKKARMVTDVFGTRESENGSYRQLCEKYGDVSYRKRSLSRNESLGTPLRYCWPNADFRSMEIISLNDWDEGHPAGSSLNDIAWFTSTTLYPFIRNSYKPYRYQPGSMSEFFVLFAGNRDGEKEWHPLDLPMDELEPEDLRLLGPSGNLTQPGGLGYEEPDMLFYPPDVDFYENKEDTPAFSILSVFIPVDSIRQDYRLRIVMTDENQETFSFELTDMVMDLP